MRVGYHCQFCRISRIGIDSQEQKCHSKCGRKSMVKHAKLYVLACKLHGFDTKSSRAMHLLEISVQLVGKQFNLSDKSFIDKC